MLGRHFLCCGLPSALFSVLNMVWETVIFRRQMVMIRALRFMQSFSYKSRVHMLQKTVFSACG